jgi:hypothetical protein
MNIGILTLSNGGNTYSSKQNTGGTNTTTTPSWYGPGTAILGQGQAVPQMSGLAPTYTGSPTASAGGTLYVSNTTGSATGPAPVLIEGATTAAGTGGILGGDGIITGMVTTNDVAGTSTLLGNYGASAANYAGFGVSAGATIRPSVAGTNTSMTLTLSGGLTLVDYSNLDFVLDTMPGTANDSKISMGAAGVLTLPSDDYIAVNFNFYNGDPELNAPYTLIGYTAADVNGGAGVSNFVGTGVPAGDAVTFNDTGSAITATFTVVPEPASIGLLGISAAGLLRRKRARVS